MWICTRDGFASVVNENREDKRLTVRTRRKRDLLALFPHAPVNVIKGRDYQFRAYIEPLDVVIKIGNMIQEIDYPNFKDSIVNDKPLKAMYHEFWVIHSRFQTELSYSQYREGVDE